MNFQYSNKIFWTIVCWVIFSSCTKSDRPQELVQDDSIQVYFNHRETGKQTYTDSYRQVERGGDNLETIILQEIATAQSTIDLAVQELNLPLIARALVKSHQSGVKVRVILDNNYSRSLSSLSPTEIRHLNRHDRSKYQEYLALVDRDRNGDLSATEIAENDALVILQQGGIEVIDDTADGSKGSGLMHHKFMVVDGQIIVTGSSNFTLSGIHGDFDNLTTKGNVNHLLRIDNSTVAELFLEEFNYLFEANLFGLAKPVRSPETIVWHNTQFTLQFSPISESRNWLFSSNGSISQAIARANDSIDLALFVFSDDLITNTLQQKHKQGVTIGGIFDSSFAFRYYSETLDLLGSTLLYRCQEEAGHNPWQTPLEKVGVPDLPLGDKLHHKFALIDGKTVITGSQNWSHAANHQNDETLIVIDNPTLARHFDREYQRLARTASWGLPTRVQNKIQQQQAECP